MIKQRLHHFDVIKGIAILLVVMGHVMIFGIHDIDKAFIFKLIDKIHMPLFFFISGYFTYKFNNGNIVKPNISSRFKQLIVPFFCVSTIWIYYFPHSGIESPLNSTWHGLYNNYWKNGYWFTLCLFELILIYYLSVPLLNKLKKISYQILLIILAYFLIGILTRVGSPEINVYLGLALLFQFFPIFFIGILARKYSEIYNSVLSNNVAITTSILGGGFLIYYVCYFWEFPKMPHMFVELMTSIGHIAVVTVAFAIIKPWSEKEFSSNKPSQIIIGLQYLGKERLSIYLLHYFFFFPMTALRQPMIAMGLGFVPLFVVSIIISLAIIAITLGVSNIISRSKLLSTILLGKV